MSEKLIKLKAWLLKYWWVFVGVLLIAVGLLLGKGKRGSLREWRKVEARIDKVEERKDARIAEIKEKREERIQDIEEEHAERIEELTDDQRETYEELRHNPEKLNSFLNDLLK